MIICYLIIFDHLLFNKYWSSAIWSYLIICSLIKFDHLLFDHIWSSTIRSYLIIYYLINIDHLLFDQVWSSAIWSSLIIFCLIVIFQVDEYHGEDENAVCGNLGLIYLRLALKDETVIYSVFGLLTLRMKCLSGSDWVR